jgi:putative transcriptional regulator
MNITREKLVTTRKNLGLTQEELAKKANITRAYLSNIESGKYNPSLEVAKNIAAILNMSIDELFL